MRRRSCSPWSRSSSFSLAVAPAGVGLGDGVGGDAAEAVEEDALLGLVEAGEGFGLRVDQGQFRGELLENGDGGGLVVDEDAALAGGEDFAAQDDFGAFGVDAVFFEDGFGAGGGLEDAGDDGLVGAVANHVGGGLAAHQQRERIDEDGLARAGFAGEQVEAGAEDGDGVIDDGVVFGAQFDEHFSGPRPDFAGRRPRVRLHDPPGRWQVTRRAWGTRLPRLSICARETARGIRAQHSMNGRSRAPLRASKRCRGHLFDNLDGGYASDTVEDEVNADFYRCASALLLQS